VLLIENIIYYDNCGVHEKLKKCIIIEDEENYQKERYIVLVGCVERNPI
jgi:hypothetical protein